VRIIARSTLKAFWARHPDAEGALRAWYVEAKKAKWRNSAEIKRDYPSASILGDRRIVFNIRGNNYRLVVAIRYRAGIVYIRFVGTHPEYDRIDAKTI